MTKSQTRNQPEQTEGKLSLRLLSAATLVGFCAFLNLYAPQPLLPLLSQVFSATKVQIGLTITATTMAVAILAPIVGTLADLIGRKRIIVAAMFGLAIPTFLSAHSATLHELIFWRFLQGIFMPGITAVIIAYITEEWAGMGVGRAISMYVSGTVLGGFCGRFITGIVTDHLGWREAFIILAVMNVISGIATWSSASALATICANNKLARVGFRDWSAPAKQTTDRDVWRRFQHFVFAAGDIYLCDFLSS